MQKTGGSSPCGGAAGPLTAGHRCRYGRGGKGVRRPALVFGWPG
jgi:hypothetical protein